MKAAGPPPLPSALEAGLERHALAGESRWHHERPLVLHIRMKGRIDSRRRPGAPVSMILLYTLAFVGCGIFIVALVMVAWAIANNRKQ